MGEGFTDWIGRSVTRNDCVTPRLVAEYGAALAPFLHRATDENACAPGLHWGLAPALPGMAELGPDGAEAKGLFLPPIPLPQRMWAGGSVETIAPFRLDMAVERHSTLTDLRQRDGKSGPLCFVTVRHEFRNAGVLLLRERQDLVFRGGKSSTPIPVPAKLPPADLLWRVGTSAALLFRFSAFTFNAHRIHY
ncbi:MAG: MaoC family dehydratase N-terminal domain-containing protein, partial [Rhizobiales bacterium]|nr:MaoC family dehydratase N-terminal domain-containing protein [Hyphomicrobiales bacterium]